MVPQCARREETAEMAEQFPTPASITFAIYSLRERALLLGLPPPPGASLLSLPPTKPTCGPADIKETMSIID